MLQRNLVEEGHNVLIFSQTRKMLNLIQVCSCYVNPCLLYNALQCTPFFCDLIYYYSEQSNCFGPFVTRVIGESHKQPISSSECVLKLKCVHIIIA